MGVSPINDQSFDQQVLESDIPVLVDFWATWCGPCLALAPKLEEISEELKEKIKIFKINVDENQEVAQKYGIRSIPTLIVFKKGKEVGQIIGNQSKEEIISMVHRST